MFLDEIAGFNKRFDRIEEMLVTIVDKILDTQMDVMKGINEVLKTFTSQTEAYTQNVAMFDACAKGFRQVRDACECLRDELSEASGTIIESTYND